MHKNKNIWCFAPLLYLISILLPMELSATITSAEYFFNSADNGPGNNTILSVTVTDGIATATGTNLSTAGLESGIHTIYSRLYDDPYGWGYKRGRTFLITSVTTDHTISAAEYFFDSNDAGAGSNPALSLSVSNGIATASGMDLATTGLASGLHTIYCRFFANNRGWGAARGIPFLISHTQTEHPISAAEYFFDSDDAGAGSNTSLSVTTSNGVATATGNNLATDGLAPGLHIVYTRFYADNQGWGPTRGVPFLITYTDLVHTITSAEYFIDTDPGPGQGTELTIAGTDNQISIDQDIDLSEASAGLHSIAVRLYSPQSGWGSPRAALFQVNEDASTSYIQSAQYFIGSSLETAEIMTVTSPSDGTFDELNEALSLTDVEIPTGPAGLKTVGVRFQRNDGYWSPWRTTNFMVVQEGPLYTISSAEYFIDTDPGSGSGTAIEEPEDGSYDETEEEFDLPVPVDGLSLGGHYVYLRLQRSDGSWGAARGNYFIVSENAQPTIAAAEYFVNPATAEGSGIAFNPADGAFNTTEEVVSAIANLASLDAQEIGNYSLFVRFQNSRDEWGPVSSQSFTVETRPQLSVNLDTLDFGTLFTGESRMLTLTVTNIGDADLEITDLGFSDPAYSSISWTGGAIPPLGVQNIEVTFAPVEPAGNHDAVLTITNNDAEKRITLLGAGLDTAPIMSVSPDSLDFGTVQTITTNTLSVRVSNSGNEDLILSGSTSTSSAFSATIANPTITPDEYVDVDITFAPSAGETYTDTLYLISNDTYFPSYPIYVTGVGSVVPVPDIKISATALDFGNIALEDAPVQQTLIISNIGTETLNISAISIDEATFTSSISGAQTIDPAGSLPMTLSFTPTQAGRYQGTLIIYNDDPDSPEMSISLSGSSVFPEMILSMDTFNFGEIGVTTSVNQSLIISNIGSDTLKITSFEKSSSIDTVLTITPATFNINPGGGLRAFNLSFDPSEPIEYTGIVVIKSNAENDTLTITGTGLDNELPVITFDTDSLLQATIVEGAEVPFSFTITDNNQIAGVSFFYRKGGNRIYNEITLTPSPSGQYNTSIPANAVGDRGIEYYFEATDGANIQRVPETAPEVPAIIRVTLPILDPITIPAETYKMFSVPTDLDLKDVSTLMEDEARLGAYDINKWRLFRWINGSYIELDQTNSFSFNPGEAYWLITKDQEVLEFESSKTVPTDGSYQIALERGWNQVGTPFSFPISVADVIAANPGVTQGEVAYSWDQTAEDWIPIDTAGTFDPFDGYFIYTPTGGNDLVFPTREGLASNPRIAHQSLATMSDEWVIQLSASTSHKRDTYNYAGVLAGAEDAWDIRDRMDPPKPSSSYVNLYFDHSDWETVQGHYAGDFRIPNSRGQVWDLVLEKQDLNEDINLELSVFNDLPEGFEILLLNRDLRYVLGRGSAANIKAVQKHFKGIDHSNLRLLVGDPGFLAEHDEGIGQAPTHFSISQNYPNPFNGNTRIQFDIPEPTALRMVIYDISGRVVRELIRSEAQPVGYHEINWDGNDDRGYHVASGIYLISLQSPGFHATRKMVLLK